MEITLSREQLQQALELTSRVSSKNPTLPVIQCVRIEALEDKIILEATNLENNISIPLTGTVVETGVKAVPNQIILQSVQLVSQKEITLRLEDNILQLETTHSSTSIKTFAVD